MADRVVLTPAQILELIPQQRPFRFIDEILEVDEEHIVGRYTFRHDEFFYPGHFPGNPITPGVILLESMGQIGVVAFGIYLFVLDHSLEATSRVVTLFAEANIEFCRPVLPGDTIEVRAEKIFWRKLKLRAHSTARLLDGTLVAEATLAGMGVRNG